MKPVQILPVQPEDRFIECLAAIDDFTDALHMGIGALTGCAAVAFNVVEVGPGLLAIAGSTFAPWLLALLVAIGVFLLIQAATGSQTCLTGEDK